MRNFIQYQSTGKISFELPVAATSGSITASIYNPGGSLTTLSASFSTGSIRSGELYTAAGPGVIAIDVKQATPAFTFKKGQHLLIGKPEENGEVITIKGYSTVSTTHYHLDLMRPLVYSHSANDAVNDTTVVVTVPTSSTIIVSKNNYIVLDYIATGSSDFAERLHKSFDVTRFIPVTNLSIEDLRDFDPQLGKKSLQGLSINSLMQKAWEMILARIGARGNMGGVVGSIDLTVPHTYLTRKLIAELDPEAKDYSDMLAQRFNEEFESVLGVTAMDGNGDGQISSWERLRNTVKFVRA